MQTEQKVNRQKIKRLLGGWGPWVLLTLGSLWLIQSALAMTKGHGVFLQGLNYDAGVVKQGTVITDEVRVTNLSAQPVAVYAQPGCGCTVVDVPNKAIAPLHTAIIKSRIDTFGQVRSAGQKSFVLQLRSGQVAWQQFATIRYVIK